MKSKTKETQKKTTLEGKKNWLIAGLILIVVILSVALVVKITTKKEPPQLNAIYSDYEDASIQIKGEDKIETLANIFGNKKNLGILLESKEEANKIITVSYQIIGENNEEIKSESAMIMLLGKGKNGYRFSLPELDGKKIRNIIVKVKKADTEKTTKYDASLFTKEVNEEVREAKDTKITTAWTYHGDSEIEQVSGLVVTKKDGKITEMGFTYKDNVAAGETFTTETLFGSQVQNKQIVAVEYDELETFISFYE